MKQYRFRTNIKCGGCVAQITPYLDAQNEIRSWRVDTEDPFKVLTVETDHLSREMVETIVRNAGFTAEPLPQDGQ